MGALRRPIGFLERPWLALGIAVLVAAIFSTLWVVRSTAQFQPDPEPVPEREPAIGVQATYTLRGMTTTEVLPEGSQATSPMENASFVAVVFDYQGTATDDVICLVELLGEDRYWMTDRYASVEDWDYQSNCRGASGTVLKFFEIPSSAVEEVRGIRIRGGGDNVILGGTVKQE